MKKEAKVLVMIVEILSNIGSNIRRIRCCNEDDK
mgnify:CR=1 FL=1